MQAAFRATAVIGLLGLALVGCGGGSARLSKAEYEAKVRTALQAVARITNATVADAQASGWVVGGARARRAAREAAIGLDGVAKRLAASRVPHPVEAANRELVSGLRALGRDYGVELEGGNARAYAGLLTNSGEGLLTRAVRALTAKGYDIEPRDGYVEQFVSSGGIPRAAKPFPFAVVSRAGSQAAVALQASFCPPQPFGQSCAAVAHLEPRTGPRADRLSVIRPGERLRLSVRHPGELLVGFDVQKLCTRSSEDLGSFEFRYFGRHPAAWRVNLPPGRYVATVSFLRPTMQGTTYESGIAGLLVSTTRQERLVPTPPCFSRSG